MTGVPPEDMLVHSVFKTARTISYLPDTVALVVQCLHQERLAGCDAPAPFTHGAELGQERMNQQSCVLAKHFAKALVLWVRVCLLTCACVLVLPLMMGSVDHSKYHPKRSRRDKFLLSFDYFSYC